MSRQDGRWILIHEQRLPDGVTILVISDITEQKRAQNELRRQRDEFRQLADAVPVLLASVDADERFRLVNSAYEEWFTVKREEVIGKTVREVVGEEVYATTRKNIDKVLSGRTVSYEGDVEYRGGGRRPIMATYVPNISLDGTVNGYFLAAQDVTERVESEQALRRYEQIVSASSDHMSFIDSNYVFQAVNDAHLRYQDRQRHEVVGRRVEDIYGPRIFKRVIKPRFDRCLSGETVQFQARFDFPAVGRRVMHMTCYPYREHDAIAGIVVSCRDVTETHELSKKLAHQATHDALTGLVNRREFERRLEQSLRTARTDRAEHAICYLDLDQFKVINDTCGHVAGDELLRQLSGLLQKRVRARDTLARLGGDEFGVLMEFCALDQAQRVATALRESIEEFRFIWEAKTFSIGVSIGLVPITRTSDSIVEVLSKADTACYAAKEKGRNRALEEGRFHLYVQPIVPVEGGEQRGAQYEMLLRMEDEEGRIVGPNVFLPAAVRYDLATKLDRWVINTVFAWLTGHKEHLKDLYLCEVNLSGHSLGDSEFLRFVMHQFAESNISPDKVCFEVTETAAIANLADATHFMQTLKRLGCRFALDDFGSGLSSFAYLKNLPVDFLKIDGVFVKDIADDPIDFTMVKSIHELGRVMGKQTIAECVENSAVLEKLKEIGVDYAQGYHIGRPRPSETVFPI